jgi:hypothetical protein
MGTNNRRVVTSLGIATTWVGQTRGGGHTLNLTASLADSEYDLSELARLSKEFIRRFRVVQTENPGQRHANLSLGPAGNEGTAHQSRDFGLLFA